VRVKPPRVAESPVQFECRVDDIIPLGREGGAGNLIISEVLMVHINDEILDEKGKINPYKLDAVARMGGNWYTRAQGESLFEVPKPLTGLGIGVDQIPAQVCDSKILTGNDLGRLGNVENLPSTEQVQVFGEKYEMIGILESLEGEALQEALHSKAKELLSQGKIEEAWMTLLQKIE